MPESQFFLPSQSCSALVLNYIIIKTALDEKKLEDKYIPDGHTAVVIHFTESERFIKSETERYKLPNRFFTMPVKMNLIFEAEAELETLIINCNTSVFSKVFGIRMDNISNKLFSNFDDYMNDYVYDKLKLEKNNQKRVKIFENYLLENYPIVDYELDEVDLIYREITSSVKNQKICELLSEIKMNHRSFRRQFLRRTGISAKELLRIVRVNHVWEMYRRNPKLNFNDIVYELSFFDQAHFINDFKKIIGETPKKFFSRDLRKVETFSGKNNQIALE